MKSIVTFKDLTDNIQDIMQIKDLSTRSRERNFVLGRQIALHIGHLYFNFELIGMCRNLGRVHGTEWSAINRINSLIKIKDPLTIRTLSLVFTALQIEPEGYTLEKRYDSLVIEFLSQKSILKKLEKEITQLKKQLNVLPTVNSSNLLHSGVHFNPQV